MRRRRVTSKRCTERRARRRSGLPLTAAASDLAFYLTANNYKLVNAYSLTSGPVTLAIPLNGLVIPNTATLVVAVHNASGSNTYSPIEYGFIGRVVTP